MENNFYFDNSDRKYLGLPLLMSNWEMRTLNSGEIIFLEGNNIVKFIEQTDTSYWEMSLNVTVSEDRIWLLPKTQKGKKTKLSSSTMMEATPISTYFRWYRESIIIGNYSSQKTFYSTDQNNIKIKDAIDLREWLNKWKDNTTEDFQRSIETFSKESRKHIQFKEGDFFAIKYDRGLYGFGRVLLDVTRLRKQKIEKFSRFMGKPVLIKQYAYLSETNRININILERCFSFPSIYIMDNVLYYGDYEIIGHRDLTDRDLDYPILYNRSNDYRNLDLIYLNIGDLYIQRKLSTNYFYGNFGQEGIGYHTNIDGDMVKKCIDDNSLYPYWSSTENKYNASHDLRNPALDQIRQAIYIQFDIKR